MHIYMYVYIYIHVLSVCSHIYIYTDRYSAVQVHADMCHVPASACMCVHACCKKVACMGV